MRSKLSRSCAAVSQAEQTPAISERSVACSSLRILCRQYAGKAAQAGLISAENANLDDYVTAKALDGLFGAIAEEERAIRTDPMRQASSLSRRSSARCDRAA